LRGESRWTHISRQVSGRDESSEHGPKPCHPFQLNRCDRSRVARPCAPAVRVLSPCSACPFAPFIPQALKTLSAEDLSVFEKLLGMLNDCDDVQEIYHNVALPS
jgi:hypothetical protein